MTLQLHLISVMFILIAVMGLLRSDEATGSRLVSCHKSLDENRLARLAALSRRRSAQYAGGEA